MPFVQSHKPTKLRFSLIGYLVVDLKSVIPLAGALMHDPVLARPPLSGLWLDQLADGLAGPGWMWLDAREQLGTGLLSGLQSEVETLQQAEVMREAGIGRGQDLIHDRGIRRDRIAWLDGKTAVQAELFRFLELLQEGLNRRLYLNLRRFEAHYASYGEGDFYRCHLDSFRGRASRVVSLVLYLNDNWLATDGGELRLFDPHSPELACARLPPEMGHLALFLSEEVPHEVLPANRNRHSIACWFRQDEVPVPLTGL